MKRNGTHTNLRNLRAAVSRILLTVLPAAMATSASLGLSMIPSGVSFVLVIAAHFVQITSTAARPVFGGRSLATQL